MVSKKFAAGFVAIGFAFVVLGTGWEIMNASKASSPVEVSLIINAEASAHGWQFLKYPQDHFEEVISCEERYGFLGQLPDQFGIRCKDNHKVDRYELSSSRVGVRVRVSFKGERMERIFIEGDPRDEFAQILINRCRSEYPEMSVEFFSLD